VALNAIAPMSRYVIFSSFHDFFTRQRGGRSMHGFEVSNEDSIFVESVGSGFATCNTAYELRT
jgi:hypothetical protein